MMVEYTVMVWYVLHTSVLSSSVGGRVSSTHTHIHTHTHIYTHTYTHTHTHTHTHTSPYLSAYTDTRKTYQTITAYTTVFLKVNLRFPNT